MTLFLYQNIPNFTSDNCSNLVDILRKRAQAQAHQIAYTFLVDGERQEINLTYQQLDRDARAIAVHLQACCQPGDRALLLYPSGLDFIKAFFGCLYAGIVAVPAYPPRRNQNMSRLEAILKDARAKVVLTTNLISSNVEKKIVANNNELTFLHYIATDIIPQEKSSFWQEPELKQDTLTFLQYTSGSTGNPKGVMVTHANLMHNSRMIQTAFSHSEKTKFVGWLPLFHDMGLIGNVLQPMYLGIPSILMSPVAFLQKPIRWLQAISKYKATTSGGPNFAYDLCIKKIKSTEVADLDLSSWKVAFNGAEPVRVDVLDNFTKMFAPCGFKAKTFYPCYGMAESTLLITGGSVNCEPKICSVDRTFLKQNRAIDIGEKKGKKSRLVGCGQSWSNQKIVIVNPQFFTECQEEEIGEIWVKGDSVANGYWQKPELTRDIFDACLQNTGERGFLRTGDLGFVRDGELFVTGRLKDLIIIRGRNYYPQDIELVAEKSHPSLRVNCAAAFAVEIVGEKQLVIAIEVERTSLRKLNVNEVVGEIRRAISEEFHLQVYGVLLLKTGTIPKTSSGKIQRSTTCDRFLLNELNLVGISLLDSSREYLDINKILDIKEEYLREDRDSIVKLLKHLVAIALNINSEHLHSKLALTSLGIDSLKAIELQNQIETYLGIFLPMTKFLSGLTIEELAKEILDSKDKATKQEGIKTVSRDRQIPLSFGSEKLWLFQELEGGENCAYNEQRSWRLTGDLNIVALKKTLLHIMQRHEILRTGFKVFNNSPVQAIDSKPILNIRVENVEYCLGKIEKIAKEEAFKPFDLSKPPLVRFTLFKLREREHVLLITIHHIICDGWSIGVFIKELSSLYQAFAAEQPSPLPELPIQYADYAVWQRESLSGELLETQLNYWKKQLSGAPELLQLPTDRPRPSVQTYRGNIQSFSINTDLSEKLQTLSRKFGTTLFMTLKAAFATLLYRYSTQSDILIGTPIANRNRSEIESSIGFFANTLVLRSSFEDNPSFEQLLGRVKETTLKAYEHQDIPFEKVVEALQPQRSLSYSPLFQVMFVLQNKAIGEVELGGVTLKELELESTIAKFDLTLSIWETERGLAGKWEYSSDLFDRATIERMAAHFENLLRAIVKNPQLSVGELPLLSEAEYHRLLVEWNDTASEYPRDKCIHQLFEEQVEKTPLSVAVVFENQRLTYQELNQKANQLARYLQSLGVEPEELVGICVEPSIDMVVGLLGILKAGGAYVPLDPNYPQERLIYILTDSGVELLLTQESLLESSPSHNARVVCLDRDWGAIEQHSQENLEVGVNSDNLAYVIYTSGSTGKPKGVLIEHKNLVHSTNARFSYYNSTLHSLLLLSSVAFDSSVAGIFWSLCSGGSLIVPKQNSLLEPLQITKLIAEHQISHLLSIPSYYGQILQHADPQALVSLHTVIVAGEVCPTTLLKLHDRAVTNASIFNEYGPTEATVWSSVYSPQDRGSQSLVPIGRPIANTQIYILDRQLQPVPIAVAGELYIGGDGLARGYLNRPELTREKFIPNPFKNSKSERLYKTGDKARYLPDGNIEFLGRIDNQVKLRGFRIELGEIEASLNTHPQVKQAIVIAKEDISGNKSLVAYVVSADRPLSSKKLRQFLASSLPEYMIPSAFVSLDTLPLTPNGKVDRKSLAELDRDLTREREYVAPRSPSEEIIANIFASVLGLPQIGIYDNFFELGGHSLLATQLISQLRATWELEIPLRAIFSSPTVAQLEPKLVQLRTQKNQLKIPPIRARKQTEELPLSWAQERLWFLNQLEGSSGTYNMPGAIRIEGDLDLNALKLALSEIVSRHEILRTSFQIFNGKPRQVIDPKATIKINPIDLKEIEATEQETLLQQQIKIEANKPFNLEIAPLIRCSLCQLDAREYILFLTMHHLVCDGWSMGIFCQELSSLYRAFSRGEPSPLPELAIQYADFALWQRKWLSKEIIETQLQYWKKQLHNAPQLLELPTARPRPRIQTYRGGTHSLSLNRDLSEKLQTLSRQTGSTLFMTLLAAFATLLSRYSSQSDILIGTPIANRHRSEIESSIGLFVNTLVIRNDLSGNPSFRELLGRVRSSSLEAYEHQDVPFEKLVEELQPERSLSYNPLFQVLFNMGNWAETQLELPGLKTEPFQTNNSLNSKFDLTLYAAEKNQKIEIELVYNSDLFASQRIVKMLQQLEYLLEQIVAEPDKSLADLSLVTPQCYQLIPEPRAVLSEQDYPNVAELFRERVKLNPENIAIVQGDLNYSYAELNQRAETIARVIKKGEVVAVSGENSFGLIASILGVVLAGGILLTIDRNLPEARKKLMWQEAQAKLILAVGSEVVIKYQEIDVISIDADSGSLSGKNLQNYEPRDICPKDPAYIFFTSGTTGTPKGVLGIHKGLSHFIEWQRNTFKVGIGDRIAQLTGLSFDVVLREIFLPLTSGATLCLPENRDDILDPIQWLKEQRITVLHTVPSLGQFWLSNSGENSLPALKWVFFAGEPLSDILVSQWRDILPHGKIVNLYGPTETTLAKCYYQIPAQIQPGIQPVGFPLPHTQALVLNSSNNLCGIGEVGQIAIRTPYRSLGYINANQEQQKRFIKNPFTKIENDLLYLSGDLGRYDSNGCLEILGRVDRQVKIRGVRIELAEIESLLTNHPQVKQAVVVVREERLVAYLALEKSEVSKQGTGKREQSIGNRQLKQTANRKQQATNNKQKNIRDFLKQKLPEYLIPSAFTIVETLPLNANGKVDRAAICVAARNALPVLKEAIENKTFISPKTLTQEIIANVFSSVLNVDLVGIEDNFFELGGHSLLATQVISRLRQSFNIDVPLRAIFESPTVAKLERLINPADVSQIEEIEIIERDGEDLPLSFAQERLWILDRLVGKSSTYNIPVAVSICGSLDIFALDKAFSEIIRRHEVLRTRFRSIDGIPVQAISPPNNFKISTIEVLEEEVQSHILQQTQTPFDLSEDNLVRSSLLCLGDREYILVIVMHHIVADGWSLGVFIRELCQLYRDFSQGKPSTLPPLPIQYFDYAVWQRQWLDSTRLSVQIDYWQEKLANVPSQLNLPLDRPRPEIMTFNGSRESLDLDLEIVKELKNLSLESGTTLYMTMLAALKVLLSYYSEQEDIVVGSPIANRNRSEIEPLIGFFVNVLVLRSHLGGNPSFLDVLERVKTTCLEAYNHQDLPFEQLISQLGLERDLSLPPLVQVIFTFHNMPEVSLGNGDLNVSLIEIPSKKAKTDLSFIVLEEKDKLTLNLEYNTDLFERETIRKILVNFKKLLKTIVKNPQQNLTEILLESSFSQKSGSILQTETIYQLSNLTQNQLLMWLGQQLNPEKPIYNNLFVSNITNAIDLEYFQKAFQTVINASDALRTVITANNGIPQQKVIPFFPYLVECIDFSEIANAREQAMKWSRDRASIPLDPEKRLFDCILLKIAADKYIWHLCLSQITLDGFSLALIYQYTTNLYASYLNNQGETELNLPQFQQYLDYERSFIKSQRYIKSKTYWENKLTEEFESINFYGSRNNKQTTNVKRISHNLGIERSNKIKEIAGNRNNVIFNIFIAILAVYLYKISKFRKLSIGIPLHNRRLKSFKNTIGSFMQVVPLIIEIQDEDTVFSLVDRIAKSSFEAMRYGQYVITDSKLQKNIYDITFNYHVEGYSHFNFFDTPTAEVKHNWIHLGHGQESLNIQVRDFNCSGDFIIDFDFHSDIFTPQLQNLAIQHFLTTLDGCLVDLSRSISQLSLLTNLERDRVLVEWNNTKVDYPADKCIHELFEEQVEETPDATAVMFEDRQLTYRELNAKANQLAYYLQDLGVCPETLVGICVERSLDTIVGLLGILKAGGAYVPLDPSYPSERLQFTIGDTQISVLVAQERFLTAIPDRHAKVVLLDRDWDSIARKPSENLCSGVSPKNLAYIIYTSGSTGTPKGVAIEHQSLANFTQIAKQEYGFEKDDRILQFASINFDAAAEEIYPCLSCGGTLVLRTEEMLNSAATFLHKCQKWELTVLDLPTAYWQQITHEIVTNQLVLPESLRLVIIGGEQATPEIVRKWQQYAGDSCQLLNTYGPTEATIVATKYTIPAIDTEKDNTALVLIGRPIGNTQIYILDSNLQPVPIGVPGELYIGGSGVARGYLNRPKLTAERFISNPLGEGRVYKTGDLARYLPDGNIEFLGRRDNQVKIRGFRIELGEIESILNSHPQIEQAIVVVREDKLIGYIVVNSPVSSLRNFLKQKLPEYSIPSLFVELKEFPLTLNGKIDRKALPKPGNTAKPDREFIPPKTKTEKIVAEIFADILNLDRSISIDEDFFELGGHSLLATQVISKVGQALNIDIPLQTVFKCSTIAQFSQAISQQEKSNLAAIKPLPHNRKNIPLSWGQERLWFLQQLEENSPSYNMSTAIKINGALDIKLLKRAIIEITRRHEILRTSFPVINGTSVQKIHPEINFEIEVFDSPLEIEKILTTEAQKPFNLSQSPLFRVTLLRLSEREQILLLMMHHIISDGWSIGVLIRELTTLYLSYSQQKPSPLPEIPVQYADYAVWQRNYLQEKILENQLNYWKQQLANIPPLLNLPTDRPRPPIQTYQGESFTIKIAPELSNKIKALAKKSGTTLYMTLLAGFATLLYRYSHQKDICIGSPIANRNHSEIEELIGFFVNTIVLRSRFENNPSFSELLTQIKQVTLDAYVNADLPFDRVVQALQPERNLSHSALFQVMFVWNKARKAWQLPEIELTEIEPKSVTAKFDITLAILEEETELITSWEYKTELFDRETILAMANNFITLLTAITKDPEQKVSQLNLLTKQESDRLVSQWNNTEREYALETVDRLFERQVKLNHQAVAIEFETEKITYLELNNRANKLAKYLQKLGVKAEVKVGICLERSIEMVIGLLAIIKAGGAYIPLDPKYPRSRIDYMLEDSQTKILLTQDKLQENFDKKNLEIISVDRDWQTISLEPETNLVSPKNGDNLAYVIYTSGSTGKPKGVEICHKSLTNFLTSMSLKPGLKNSDTLLAITTICFDIAALEIYLPLIVGAKIILASEEQSADGNQLKEILERNEITVMQATPATWRSLLAANWQGKERLKILCGGEKLTPDLANNLLTKSAELWNLYGPTEATIWATINKIEESKETKNSIVSIGHPIANTRVYILDKHLKPVPLGVAGELYIGGIQLARGYLNKPQLTKERFIDSPWGRLYKTGDLVRYLKNGKIEYLDRADNQVKIRGFRIELGEIESILNTHPDIQQAIVTAKDEILVAYLVLEGTTNNKQQDIKDYLKQQLPEYMIPSAFVVLETFPLTPNGKIDRKALPLPDLESIDRKEYIPPRNDLEKRLVQIWTEVLKIKEIGVVDSFFDLGGHSLLAIRLMAQIEQEYGKKIPLTSLFQNPTIAQLAKLIRSDSIETNSVLVPIKTTGKRSPLFCIHPIEGSVFCYQDLANHLKDYPVYGLQSIGLEGHSTPLTKIEDMASQYIEAIETIQQTGPYHLAGWSLGGVIAFEIARQLSDRGEKIAYLSLIDSHSPSTINFSKTKDQSEFFVEITENLSRRLNLNFDISLAEIKALSPEDKFKYLFNRAKELKILPLEKIEQLLQVYQANFMAFSQYQPKKYSGIINLFRASENQKKSFALGWDKIAKVKTIIIASNHYQIIRSDRLSQYIKKQLN